MRRVADFAAARARRAERDRRYSAFRQLCGAEAQIGPTFDPAVSLRIDAALVELESFGVVIQFDRWGGPWRAA